MENPSAKNPASNSALSGDELSDLRMLLLSPEQARIAELERRLSDPKIRSEETSRVLAEAIIIRASRDKKLAKALLPTIEETIRDSVRRDPKFLAEAIFPVIGPAIRKAISESLRAMMQSFNNALQLSLSWQGLKWRLESIRTGRPFVEIVLLHTLVYRVEQVLLIHKETGLVLQHAAATSVDMQNADMVSGMLTAIQDFVRDSFSVEETQELQTLHIGELTVWIEQGPQAVLAAIIRGTPPQELQLAFQETLENIHFEHSQALGSFQGDTAPFESTKHYLESCLVEVRREATEEKQVPTQMPSEKTKATKAPGETNFIWWIVWAGIICLLFIVAGALISHFGWGL